MGEYCEVCGSPRNVELHHVIFRSKAPYMSDVEINLKYLCNEHHRGNRGPHLCREIDIKYKVELQYKLSEIFENKFYSAEETRDKLGITDKEIRKIVKTLNLHPEGYSRLDIISKLMGGRLYIK